jgi:homoserine kinase type II
VRLARIERFHEPRLAALAPPLGARLSEIVARRDASLPRGLVHGDLFRDNVLWGKGGEGPDADITALLDFESACEGGFAFDLMVTVLAWCFRDTLEPALSRAMVAGYNEVRRLTDAEAEGLCVEGRLAALRFTVTRITDDAMRSIELGVPPRRDKDWRRFAARSAELEALGTRGLRQLLGLTG